MISTSRSGFIVTSRLRQNRSFHQALLCQSCHPGFSQKCLDMEMLDDPPSRRTQWQTGRAWKGVSTAPSPEWGAHLWISLFGTRIAAHGYTSRDQHPAESSGLTVRSTSRFSPSRAIAGASFCGAHCGVVWHVALAHRGSKSRTAFFRGGAHGESRPASRLRTVVKALSPCKASGRRPGELSLLRSCPCRMRVGHPDARRLPLRSIADMQRLCARRLRWP